MTEIFRQRLPLVGQDRPRTGKGGEAFTLNHKRMLQLSRKNYFGESYNGMVMFLGTDAALGWIQ